MQEAPQVHSCRLAPSFRSDRVWQEFLPPLLPTMSRQGPGFFLFSSRSSCANGHQSDAWFFRCKAERPPSRPPVLRRVKPPPAHRDAGANSASCCLVPPRTSTPTAIFHHPSRSSLVKAMCSMKDKSPSATRLTRSREHRHSWIYLAFEGSSFCIWTLSFP